MSAFSADWLALREPADAAARSVRLASALASTLPRDRAITILDLGCGTGSNVRVLAEHFPWRQGWTLVDRDATLLDAIPERMRSWAAAKGYEAVGDTDNLSIRGAQFECALTRRHKDLRAAVADPALYDEVDVVTASALLDLVSEDWMQTLASHCAQRNASVLFALTYDGRIDCTPAEAEDELIRELVNRHQHTDKGFGAALGPDATHSAQACFARLGYEVGTEASDWVLDSRFSDLQGQLIDGWARAAAEIAPTHATTIDNWRTRRFEHLDAARSRLIVGHTDLAAWPISPSENTREDITGAALRGRRTQAGPQLARVQP